MKTLIMLSSFFLLASSYATTVSCHSFKTDNTYSVDLENGSLKIVGNAGKEIRIIRDLKLSANTVELYPVSVLNSLSSNDQVVFEFMESEGKLIADFESDTGMPCKYL